MVFNREMRKAEALKIVFMRRAKNSKKNWSEKIMKAIIVRKVERFIVCENCGYERSYHLEADVGYDKFDWNCPSCDQHWGGLMWHDGSILIGQLKDQERRHIVVELPEPWSPFTITATRSETPKETADRNGRQTASVSEIFYLAPCAPDAEINPKGLAQYKTRDF